MPKFKLNSDKNLSIVARPVHNYEQENLAETLEFVLPVSLLGRNVLDCITSVHIIDASEHADVITLDLSVSERNPNYLVDSFKLSGLFTQEDGLIRLWVEIIDRTDTAIIKTNEVSFPVFRHEVVDEYITDDQISFIEQGLIQTADYVDQAREYAEGAGGSAAAAQEIAQSVRDDADAGVFDGKPAYPVKNVSSEEEVSEIQSAIASGAYSADTAYAFVTSAFSTYFIGDMLAITADDVTIDFRGTNSTNVYVGGETPGDDIDLWIDVQGGDQPKNYAEYVTWDATHRYVQGKKHIPVAKAENTTPYNVICANEYVNVIEGETYRVLGCYAYGDALSPSTTVMTILANSNGEKVNGVADPNSASYATLHKDGDDPYLWYYDVTIPVGATQMYLNARYTSASDVDVKVYHMIYGAPERESTEENATIKYRSPQGGFRAIETGGGATWGDIDGTLTEQTDLQNALDNKVDAVLASPDATAENKLTDLTTAQAVAQAKSAAAVQSSVFTYGTGIFQSGANGFNVAGGKLVQKSYTSAGQNETIYYWAYIPDFIDDENGMPLIVHLHSAFEKGSTAAELMNVMRAQDANGKTLQSFPRFLADNRMGAIPAYVVMPQMATGEGGGGWYTHRAVINELVRALVADTVEIVAGQSNYINPNNVGLSGFSLGAHGVWELAYIGAKNHNTLYKNIVPIAGKLVNISTADVRNYIKDNVNVLTYYSLDDGIVKVEDVQPILTALSGSSKVVASRPQSHFSHEDMTSMYLLHRDEIISFLIFGKTKNQDADVIKDLHSLDRSTNYVGIPKKVSELNNDSDFAPKSYVNSAVEGKADKPVPETITIPTSSWSALADSAPFDYSATVTITTTLGENSTVELINNNALLFANHGFSILSVSGQTATIASIGQPDDSVTLKVVVING